MTRSSNRAGRNPSGARPRSGRWTPSGACGSSGSTAVCTRATAILRRRQRREWPRTPPCGGGEQQAGRRRLGAAAPALPPLTALRAAEKRPPPPRTAVTRNHSCWRPEALPLLLSQDGGGYRDRAAVFRHVQAPERGGNAAGASGTAAPLFFPLLPAPCCPRRGLPGRRRRLGGAERRWAGEAG